MTLYIRNMVCHRCRLSVQAELEKLGLHPTRIELGEATVREELTKDQRRRLADALAALGFELMDDKRSRLIEQIKLFIIDQVHYRDEQPRHNYSELLSRHLHHDYSYLSHLFSATEGITIEQYIITQKIEKVKELLVYNELSLAAIALQLGYSSTAHLSAQFKKLTGLTPSAFRRLGASRRRGLDEAGNAK